VALRLGVTAISMACVFGTGARLVLGMAGAQDAFEPVADLSWSGVSWPAAVAARLVSLE